MTAPRPTRQQRGYNAAYDRERGRWKPIVEAGFAHCWRCGGWIDPAGGWHLGHDDHDRRVIHGPEHPACNLGAAARKTNALRRSRSTHPRPVRSRTWL